METLSLRTLKKFRASLPFNRVLYGHHWGSVPFHTMSAGQCVPVALLVQDTFGGQLVSATIGGVSHWFNEIGGVYVDLTGDQFGRAPIQAQDYAPYENVRTRLRAELSAEAVQRYEAMKQDRALGAR